METDKLTLAEAVAELERKRDNLKVFAVGHPAIAALECALAILRRVDTGEAERLLDALEALCKRATTSGDGILPETEQYYLCAGWRWSGSGAKACVHIDGEQQYEGDTLRAALRELAKEEPQNDDAA